MVGREVRWTPPAGTTMTLVYVLDAELAASRLEPGHAYIAAVSASDASFKRLAFASRRFTAP